MTSPKWRGSSPPPPEGRDKRNGLADWLHTGGGWTGRIRLWGKRVLRKITKYFLLFLFLDFLPDFYSFSPHQTLAHGELTHTWPEKRTIFFPISDGFVPIFPLLTVSRRNCLVHIPPPHPHQLSNWGSGSGAHWLNNYSPRQKLPSAKKILEGTQFFVCEAVVCPPLRKFAPE